MQKDPIEDKEMRKDAPNVQAALKELGLDVSFEDTDAVWVRRSSSIRAEWLAGAETFISAKLALISYCALGTDDFMRGVEDQPLH